MYQKYELHSGDRLVGVRTAFTPQAALFDYVRSLGCLDEDVVKLAPDVIAWRGAVFKATAVPSSASPATTTTRGTSGPSANALERAAGVTNRA